MYKGKSFICIIPARGGSKGIRNKNIIPLLGRPLIYYVIQSARESEIFDSIVVSTDSPRIREIALLYGVEVINRPTELAQDDTPTEPVIAHALKQLGEKYDYVQLLEPTTPLVGAGDIKGAAKKIIETKADMIIGVAQSKFHWVGGLGKNNSLKGWYPEHLRRKPRQQIDTPYYLTGEIYLAKWDVFYNEKDFYEQNTIAYIQKFHRHIDINYGEDLIEAEKQLKIREHIRTAYA